MHRPWPTGSTPVDHSLRGVPDLRLIDASAGWRAIAREAGGTLAPRRPAPLSPGATASQDNCVSLTLSRPHDRRRRDPRRLRHCRHAHSPRHRPLPALPPKIACAGAGKSVFRFAVCRCGVSAPRHDRGGPTTCGPSCRPDRRFRSRRARVTQTRVQPARLRRGQALEDKRK